MKLALAPVNSKLADNVLKCFFPKHLLYYEINGSLEEIG
jgi:hypothetical protein